MRSDNVDLFPSGSYDTPPGRRDLADRLLLGSRLYYHSLLIPTIVGHARLIRKGAYSTADWQADSMAFLQAVERVGGRVHVRGLDGIGPRDRPVVLVGNHMSSLETWLLCCMVLSKKRNLTFVVKDSLLRMPFFKHFLLACKAIPVTRSSPADDLRTVLREGAERLSLGYSVAIFPQRTRSRSFDMADFNSIGVKLAKRAGAPVVPVALRTDFLEPGWPVKEFGSLHRERDVWFEFGHPIEVEGNGRAQHEAVAAFIAARLEAWGVPVSRSASAE